MASPRVVPARCGPGTSRRPGPHGARGALAAALIAAALAAPAASSAQAPASLDYRIRIIPQTASVGVEARLEQRLGGALALLAPPQGFAGTSLTGFVATDGAGRPLEARPTPTGYSVAAPADGIVLYRYTVTLLRRASDGSTGAGLDSTRLYAVTRSLIIAPDPTAWRKTGAGYPLVRVRVEAPPAWQVVAGWPQQDGVYRPATGDDLVGATLAAAADFRRYDGSVGASRWQLAVRGRRYFSDSALAATVSGSLAAGADALGGVPTPLVTYTAEVGRKGRLSGSLQGTASIGLVWEPGEVLELNRSHDLFHETLHLWFGGALESERWWVEGVTDYLAARLLARWRDTPDDLAFLCFQSLRNYQAIEHNTRYNMVEEHRRRVDGDNTELLVYRKGMLAGLLLDAALRRDSRGQRSLDDLSRAVLRAATRRSSRFVPESEIRDTALSLGGAEVRQVWERVVTGTALLTEDDVTAALREVTGRTFEAPAPRTKEHKALRR